MRKNVFGRKLKRDANQRKALVKGLISSLIVYEKITTTEAKAKAVKGQVDKVVNLARRDNTAKEGLLQSRVAPNAMPKLLNDLANRFTTRTSGYTRLIRLGNRRTDSASMVVMEWVEGPRGLATTDKTAKTKKPMKDMQKNEATVKVATPKKSAPKKAPAKKAVAKKEKK